MKNISAEQVFVASTAVVGGLLGSFVNAWGVEIAGVLTLVLLAIGILLIRHAPTEEIEVEEPFRARMSTTYGLEYQPEKRTILNPDAWQVKIAGALGAISMLLSLGTFGGGVVAVVLKTVF